MPTENNQKVKKQGPGRGGPRPGSGRPKGTANRATQEFRETVRQLLDDNAENIGLWLAQVAKGIEPVLDAEGKVAVPGRPGSPAEAVRLVNQLADFATPRLSRSEVTGDAGAPLSVVIHKLG